MPAHHMRIICASSAQKMPRPWHSIWQIEERARGYMPAKIKRLLLVARNNEILQETALHALRSMPKNNK
jgi:hypothetical protein